MRKFKVIFMLLVASSCVYAAETEIGTFMSPAKHVIANGASGSLRAPTMGDKLFLGDEIKIGSEERRNVQIRLTDGTLFSCAAGTSFTISIYSFEKQPSDSLQTQITKGGCRILAGNIDRPGAAGQRWGSPTAVMGLAGTLAGIVVLPNETAAGIFQGHGHLGNAEHPLDLGHDDNFDFTSTLVGMSYAEPEAFEYLETLPREVEGGLRKRVNSDLLADNEVAPITQQELDGFKWELRGHFKGRAMLKQHDLDLDVLGEGLRCE